jgi:[acyl-carrier-protein] S-malonyltransferase
MAAIIGLASDVVAEVCREAAGAEVVSAANLNGGGQVVIAGHKDAVDRAAAAAKARGAKLVKLLAVSAPFHCALMQPAADRLASELARVEVKTPAVPVVSNVEAKPNQDAARVKDLLARQVTAPVRWEESVQCLAGLGVNAVVEVGAGNVLGALVRRIAPDIAVHAAGDPSSIEALTNA